ncbi:hypothetical protein [Methylocystis sp. IM2]|uniref:hypothetical protein n=1 Tax=Methylocystis sp. IM2 TaxID=3136563 RepID=UPI000FA92D9F|nr:MAG: hypothetical protein EKK29_20265 [Hyphomicrobiales bacterium]
MKGYWSPFQSGSATDLQSEIALRRCRWVAMRSGKTPEPLHARFRFRKGDMGVFGAIIQTFVRLILDAGMIFPRCGIGAELVGEKSFYLELDIFLPAIEGGHSKHAVYHLVVSTLESAIDARTMRDL